MQLLFWSAIITIGLQGPVVHYEALVVKYFNIKTISYDTWSEM